MSPDLGLWLLRFMLAAGTIYLARHDKDDAALVCAIVLLCTFLFQ